MLPHPQATSTGHGGPRTTDLLIERRRRNHFTTAPHGLISFEQLNFVILRGGRKLEKSLKLLFVVFSLVFANQSFASVFI